MTANDLDDLDPRQECDECHELLENDQLVFCDQANLGGRLAVCVPCYWLIKDAPVVAEPVEQDAPAPQGDRDLDAERVADRPTAAMLLETYDTPRVIDGRTLSRYQANILEWVERGHGDGIVGAVAGSGKTTTLTMAARILSGDALFLAFNKRIAAELGTRLAGTKMVAKTIHSIGLETLIKAYGKMAVDGKKYDALAEREVKNVVPLALQGDRNLENAAKRTLARLVDMVRLTLTQLDDAAAVTDLCEAYGIDVPAHDSPLLEDAEVRAAFIAAAGRMLQTGMAQATNARARVVDFTDMIYLPVALGLTPTQLPFVMVDECQDLNRAQLELVLACRAPGGRMLFVGDPRQAIYGFAGADCDSFWTIQRRTGATLLSLSVCYRCPTSVVALAREIVPEIEPAPGAPAGTVAYVRESELARRLVAGDMVVCRLTAPLVSLCMKLIGARVPAKVVGREIGASITAIVKKVVELPGYSWATFGEDLGRYEAMTELRLSARKDAEAQVEALKDKCEAVRACHANFTEAQDADHLRALIEGLFSGDNDKAPVVLSTVHRAKGLENAAVYILRPDKLPLQWPSQSTQEAEQEQNLRYVAITRAMSALYFVEQDEA
jgi:DNA helicase-2/ATP-dependent DNA helicase PcrA